MRSLKSNRGSALIVALIMAAVLAISLTSYLKLSVSAGQLANRAFYLNAAQNILDIGVERTLWSLNNEYLYPSPTHWSTAGFTARSGYANEYQATFPSSTTYYNLSGGVKGQIKVWVGDYDTTNQIWHVVCKATVILGDGTALSKVAESYLQQRSFSDGGMIARNGISFNGNVRVDSWISRPTAGADIPYSTSVARCEAQISSPALIALQNADVFGYASIGTPAVTSDGITVGSTGRLRGSFTAPVGIDASRVTCDFTSSFPDVNPASAGTWLAAIVGGETELTTGTYSVPSITFGGSGESISIGKTAPANVTLTVTGNLTMSGPSRIYIYPGSTLKLYVGGDLKMTGASGIQNGTATVPNNPDCLTILGLRTAADVVSGGGAMADWTIRGTAYLSCVLFAPNANVDVDGTGDTYGSIVANDVDMVGSGNFHQDESLATKRISGLWKLLKWRELSTESDRTTYLPQLTF